MNQVQGSLGKFKEGKFIAGYLQKPALTQEVPLQGTILEKMLPNSPVS